MNNERIRFGEWEFSDRLRAEKDTVKSQLYLQALEMRRKLLGEEHPNVATSLNNLAYLYKLQGRYDEAEPLYLQALEMSKKLLGEEHPQTQTISSNLLDLRKNLKQLEK